LERIVGVEPTTSTMATWRSTAELHPRHWSDAKRQRVSADAGRSISDSCKRPGAHMKNPSRPRLGGVLHAPHRDDVRTPNSSARAYPPARRDMRRASGSGRGCSAFSQYVSEGPRVYHVICGAVTRKIACVLTFPQARCLAHAHSWRRNGRGTRPASCRFRA
jgi:hypothetical protein